MLNVIRKFDALLLAMYLPLCVGCNRTTASESTQGSSSAADLNTRAEPSLKLPGEARLGDRTTCTVHKEHQLVVTAATPKVDYKGKTYYFCCPVCANKFGERPQDYVKD